MTTTLDWLVVVCSLQAFSDDDIGYEIASIRCASKSTATRVVKWITENTRAKSVACLIVEDSAR